MTFKILATIFVLNLPVFIVGMVGFAITDNYCIYKVNKVFKKITAVSGIILGIGIAITICVGIFGLLKMIWS